MSPPALQRSMTDTHFFGGGNETKLSGGLKTIVNRSRKKMPQWNLG